MNRSTNSTATPMISCRDPLWPLQGATCGGGRDWKCAYYEDGFYLEGKGARLWKLGPLCRNAWVGHEGQCASTTNIRPLGFIFTLFRNLTKGANP